MDAPFYYVLWFGGISLKIICPFVTYCVLNWKMAAIKRKAKSNRVTLEYRKQELPLFIKLEMFCFTYEFLDESLFLEIFC